MDEESFLSVFQMKDACPRYGALLRDALLRLHLKLNT